jgi:hypothetical protein
VNLLEGEDDDRSIQTGLKYNYGGWLVLSIDLFDLLCIFFYKNLKKFLAEPHRKKKKKKKKCSLIIDCLNN